jgi:hypothetical protein
MAHLFADVANARTNEELSALYGLLLREDSDAILNVMQAAYVGDIAGSPSNVIQVTDYDDAAYNGFASRTEIQAISPTDPAPAKTDVTVARYGFARRPSDLVKMTDSHGVLNPAMLAQDFLIGANQKLVELVAGLMSGFSATSGSAAAVAQVADFFDACSTLRQANANGQLVALLHPKQWGELTKEIATVTGGALQLAPSAQENIISRGSGFQGTLNGVAVYTSTRVASSGGGYNGGIFDAAKAVAWADATPVVEMPERQLLVGKVLFEMDREPLTAETIYAGNVWLGVAERQDAAGVTFISTT